MEKMRAGKRSGAKGGGPERKREQGRVATAPQVATRGSTADLDQTKPQAADTAQREGQGCSGSST